MPSYAAKVISVTEALGFVKSGDVIVTGLGAAEARNFLAELHTIAPSVSNVSVTTCLPMQGAEYFMNPAYSEYFRMAGWFYTGPMRKMHAQGHISFIPNHLHLASSKRLAHVCPDIFVGTATRPDKHGYISLSLSNVYEKTMLAAAGLVIIEVNPKLPRTFGDCEVHVDDVDYFIEVAYDIPELPDEAPSGKDLAIGQFIADMVKDGDCLQLGIGGIPNAVAFSLLEKKHLGIHTEMMTTGLMRLIKAGAVTNKRKNLYPGKSVCCFALGTRELYDFIDDNPSVLILDGRYVNDPAVIGQNDNQVSINTTLEVDLTGQCCSESIGHVQYSGTGGQTDTAVGAQRAKNGRSFIALYSTAQVKNRQTGESEEISKIVSTLKPGAIVSLSRNDVDYVVTEYGIASLRGTDVPERVRRLIAIAHPSYREQLMAEAKNLGYIARR